MLPSLTRRRRRGGDDPEAPGAPLPPRLVPVQTDGASLERESRHAHESSWRGCDSSAPSVSEPHAPRSVESLLAPSPPTTALAFRRDRRHALADLITSSRHGPGSQDRPGIRVAGTALNMSKLGADGKRSTAERQGSQGPDYFPQILGLAAPSPPALRRPCGATMYLLCVVQFWPCLVLLDFAPGRPWPS